MGKMVDFFMINTTFEQARYTAYTPPSFPHP